MRLEAHNELGQPICIDVSRVVVYDDADNPVIVAVKHKPGWIYVGHIRDKEFNDYLTLLGINQTTIISELKEE